MWSYLFLACATAEPCSPGTTEFCACDGGFPGEATCDPDGAWGACDCPYTGRDEDTADTGPHPGQGDYLGYCAPCHGTTGLGGNGGPSLVASVPGLDDAALQRIIREGQGGMPAFPSLSDDQVDRLVDYLRDTLGE